MDDRRINGSEISNVSNHRCFMRTVADTTRPHATGTTNRGQLCPRAGGPPAPLRGSEPWPGRSAGFTLIEVLVVIAIIAVLLGILIPAVMSGRTAAEAGATAQFMNSLRTALIAYQRDHDAFPPSGADNLRDALLAPGDESEDGHDGPGFKKQRGGSFYGPTYGPYMEIANAEDLDDQKRFVDYWANVIHYATAKPGEFSDNQLWGGGNARFDLPGERPEKVDASELRAARFVLHSSGPDGQSGNEDQREDDIIVTGP